MNGNGCGREEDEGLLFGYLGLLLLSCWFLSVFKISFYDPAHDVHLNSLNTAPFLFRELSFSWCSSWFRCWRSTVSTESSLRGVADGVDSPPFPVADVGSEVDSAGNGDGVLASDYDGDGNPAGNGSDAGSEHHYLLQDGDLWFCRCHRIYCAILLLGLIDPGDSEWSGSS